MKRRSINGKLQKAIALIASLSVAACQFSAAIPVNAAETEEAQPAIAAESDEAQTEKAAEADETQSEKTDEAGEAQSEKTDETEETQSEKTDEADETQSENTDETEQSEKLKAEPCLSVDKTVRPASAAGQANLSDGGRYAGQYPGRGGTRHRLLRLRLSQPERPSRPRLYEPRQAESAEQGI